MKLKMMLRIIYQSYKTLRTRARAGARLITRVKTRTKVKLFSYFISCNIIKLVSHAFN